MGHSAPLNLLGLCLPGGKTSGKKTKDRALWVTKSRDGVWYPHQVLFLRLGERNAVEIKLLRLFSMVVTDGADR